MSVVAEPNDMKTIAGKRSVPKHPSVRTSMWIDIGVIGIYRTINLIQRHGEAATMVTRNVYRRTFKFQNNDGEAHYLTFSCFGTRTLVPRDLVAPLVG